MQQISLTVRQLNLYVRSLLEGDSHLSSLTLEGELSNFKNHYASGHWYFALKDADATVRGVMFKGNAARVNFLPRDGMKVVCRGYVSLYEKDGQFQFYAESMRPFGEGDLAAEFERIKQKLEAEGLFSADRKRPLPAYPEQIGIITSEAGAALQDMLQILSRRYPLCRLRLYPALVQGSMAPASLIAALQRAYRDTDLDLLIIGRGGGSAEDLSCFNDEALARTVATAPVPIISAVGHEVDFTICDFVSDLRAPTPSAAAELATPDVGELRLYLEQLEKRAKASVMRQLEQGEQRLASNQSRRCFAHPELLFSPFELRLDMIADKLEAAYLLRLRKEESVLERLAGSLLALSPKRVLERGYSVTFCGGAVVKEAAALKKKDQVQVHFADGSVSCIVEDVLCQN